MRFGAYHLYLPALLKPAPRALAAQLWALKHGGLEAVKGIDEVAHLASSGRTSFAADPQVNRGLYRAAGFRVCGERAVRVDILERLADLIRPAIAYRPGVTVGDPPAGAADGEGFVVTVAMTSLAGCSGEAFASILKSLGYANEQRPGPAITGPIIAKAAMEPIKPPVAAEAAPAAEEAQAVEAAQAVSEAPVETTAEAEAPAEAPIEAEAPVEPAQASEAPPPVEVVEAAAPVEEIAETAAPATEAVEPTPEADAETATSLAGGVAPVAEAEAAPVAEAEAVAEQTEAAPEVEAAPAEPVLIEVWKPQRHQHARRQGHGQEGRDHQHRRHGHRRPQGAPQAAGEAATPVEGQAPQAQEAGAPQEQRQFDRPRRDDRRQEGRAEGGKPRFEGKRQEGGRQEGGRKFEGKFDGKRRDDQRGNDRPFNAEKRPPREKQADPDSPFAKLAALKAELEAKNKKS